MPVSKLFNIVKLAVPAYWRKIVQRLRSRSASRFFGMRSSPERILFAPENLRTPDRFTANEIYSGNIFLAGKMIDCGNHSPFEKLSAPMDWQRELHRFVWLHHLEVTSGDSFKGSPHKLLSSWLSLHSRPDYSIAWQPETVARRLISWICHSIPITETATPVLYGNWLKSIGIHIRFLKSSAPDSEDGLPRLISWIALAYSLNCVSGQQRFLRKIPYHLDKELERQILIDGCHISRNPEAITELLALLLPLRHSYQKLGREPSRQLISSIDRLMTALKFFRLGDGNLARFNGVSSTHSELIATILYYDDSMGNASENASKSGFQRMEQGETILLADTGVPPKNVLSKKAHAGTLSFEISCNSNLVMINCGLPAVFNDQLLHLARSSAAHNTAIINDTSSSRFYTKGWFKNVLAGWMTSSPTIVKCARQDSHEKKQFTAIHNGYQHPFGLLHSRTIKMFENGTKIFGEDSFNSSKSFMGKSNEPQDFSIRFHLHPSVSAGKSEDGSEIILLCGKGITWKFSSQDIIPQLEESIFLAATGGPRRTKQIVLHGSVASNSKIHWQLDRVLN